MEKKLWGLFTGSQVTVMVTAALLCIAIPGGLWASGIQYSFVSLYDAKSKQTARLGAGGSLKVTNGVGPLAITGAVAVNGNVTEAAPANFVRTSTGFGTTPVGCPVKLITAPATNGLIVKTLTLDTSAVTTPGSSSVLFYIGDCSALVAIQLVTPATFGLTTENLEPGIALPPGGSISFFSTGVSGFVTSLGYLVPASSVPAASAVTAQGGGRVSQLR